MSDLAYKYNQKKNLDGGSFPGVPLRDLTVAEFEALPIWLQGSVDAAAFYSRVKGYTLPTPPEPEPTRSEVDDG